MLKEKKCQSRWQRDSRLSAVAWMQEGSLPLIYWIGYHVMYTVTPLINQSINDPRLAGQFIHWTGGEGVLVPASGSVQVFPPQPNSTLDRL